MPISALPTPPSRSDSPQDFSDRADALLGALPGFVTEANALQSDVNAKESSASSYATIATNKAVEAQGHATTASTKASEAAASAIAAAAAASNAEIAFDSFDDKYLGSKASDPATDNDGNPLLTGALYWNTTVGAVRVWNGSAWLSMAADASIVDFQQAGAGAVVRTAQDRMREWVSVLDFGADPTGVADSTTAIQSALNSGAKRVTAPAGGTYRITNTLTIDADRVELDLKGSELLLDDSTGLKSHIKLGNGSVQRGGIQVRNIVFTRQQAATAGYAIDSDLIGVCEITGCRIYGNNEIWRGIRIYRGIIINIQNNYIDNCVNRGIFLQGSGTGANRTVDVTIRENRVEGGTTALETSDFVEGLFCRDNIFFNTSGTGVVVDASSNANGLVSFKFQNNDFDTCGGPGLYMDKVSNVQVTGCWFSANGGDDLLLKESTDGVVVVGNQFYPNAFAINCLGNAARITGNLVSGGTTCINISASATRTDISGNTLSSAQYAVNLGTATNTHFVGNSIYGMSLGAVSGAGGTGTVVQNNKGDSSVGGNAFITVGASPFTYTAGPRPEYVSIFDGTVSNIQLGSNSIGFSTNRGVVLAPNQSVTVTYSSVPFMVKNLL